MDFSNKKIVVAGIGGVGGLLGACLCETYPHVYFVARGKKKDILKEHGLILESEAFGHKEVRPFMVTDQPSEIGEADIVFICVKNYSLDQMCGELKCIVGKDTIIVPVLNGVEHGDKCREAFPFARVVDALIYTISGCDENCVVTQKGGYSHVHVGTESEDERIKSAVSEAAALIKGAGIDCIVEENIKTALWTKYLTNCSFNILTSAFRATVGELRANPQAVEDMRELLEEAYFIARRKGVPLPANLVEERMNFFLHTQAADGTSSMKRDIDAGRQTELETFSGYLLREAEELTLNIPRTRHYYNEIRAILNPEADAPMVWGSMDYDSLMGNLKFAQENFGKDSKEAATCMYALGQYYINHGDAFKAMDYLGDALYIRKSIYDDDSLRIKEILNALEVTTFM